MRKFKISIRNKPSKSKKSKTRLRENAEMVTVKYFHDMLKKQSIVVEVYAIACFFLRQ